MSGTAFKSLFIGSIPIRASVSLGRSSWLAAVTTKYGDFDAWSRALIHTVRHEVIWRLTVSTQSLRAIGQ
jgi:hypothetical protein